MGWVTRPEQQFPLGLMHLASGLSRSRRHERALTAINPLKKVVKLTVCKLLWRESQTFHKWCNRWLIRTLSPLTIQKLIQNVHTWSNKHGNYCSGLSHNKQCLCSSLNFCEASQQFMRFSDADSVPSESVRRHGHKSCLPGQSGGFGMHLDL